MLHWANKDQYYTKSGESFSNYAFTLENGKKVQFRLVEADTAKDNRKDNEQARVFALIEPQIKTETDENGDEIQTDIRPIEENGDLLTIRFEYKAVNKKEKQSDYITQAVEKIQNFAIPDEFQGIFKAMLTEKNKNRTLLEKYLTDYTAKNTADYFIHKNLGKFLNQELDFYIKNEVMNLDNIQDSTDFSHIEQNLQTIKTIKTVAKEIIAFLAQLEDFQKKLWLKKKFVAGCHYLITLDHLNEAQVQTALENPKQTAQWQALFNVNTSGLNVAELCKNYPHLVVDTALFEPTFQADVLSEIEYLDDKTNGLLIHSDNFQALNLLQERYKEQVKCIYIDPPYNTGSDNDFIYKDNYQHSSWVAMMSSRFELARDLIQDNSGIWVSTDDGEYARLQILMADSFGNDNFVGDIIWNSRKSMSSDALISGAINHTTFFAKNKVVLDKNKSKFRLPETMDGFENPDNDLRGAWKLDPLDAPNVRENLSYGITNPNTGETFYPPEGRCWRFEKETVDAYLKDGRILFGKTGKTKPAFKRFYEEAKEKGKVTNTLWDDVGTTTNGTKLLHALFNNAIPKEKLNKIKPKPIEFMQKIFQLHNEKLPIYMDYFAGSGTTAHAVINLNREDNGNRKYILVEQGEYFDTVLKPRVQKVIFSEKWKEGKPEAEENGSNGVSQIVKVLKLESYEDTLNNLELRKPSNQFDFDEQVQQDYLLHYMLDVESRGSLLSTDHFAKPFDYELNIATSSVGVYHAQKIDLVETFNYLIGLRVEQVNDERKKRGIVTVLGKLPSGEKTLIIWRDVNCVGYEELNRYLESRDINPQDSEFDVVYINGDHNIPTVFADSDDVVKTLKVRSIEAEFLERMFG
ncbi:MULTISPECIES: site-specific DNA-methyltransferase [Haemophilus]|jgi:DNA methylase N-4/N-6 domain protein|uniref:site-specific DNA-methyltransferase n=1 Tax=Haemophilus TaxID=724 RepID=UPI001CF8E7DF|nr:MULTISPECIES: site-specific DNA-methyltransferase [Haemophilus]